MPNDRWPISITSADGSRHLIVHRAGLNRWVLKFKGEGTLIFSQPPAFDVKELKDA